MADISSVKLQDNQTYYFKDNSAIVSISRSGNTYTATKHDGTTFEFTQKDDNTTYTFEDGVNSFTVTPSNGTAQTVTVTPSIPNATQSSDGLMSATDKTKLDGVANGAEVNQNAFSNIKVGSTTLAADSKTDTLEFVAGDNITLTPTEVSDKITISSSYTNTTYTLTQDATDGHKFSLEGTDGYFKEITIPDANITYTIEADTTNNKIKLIPSSGSAVSITVPFATNATNATNATKATGDESGNNIKNTYAASFSISDHTITLKNKNGTSLGTVTVPDNNTTYTFAEGTTDKAFSVTPSGGTAQTVSIHGLGSASTKDVASSGNASSSQVVMGNDTRLTDSRTPKSHTHTKSEITDFPTLGTAAAKNYTTSVTQNSSDLVTSGAVWTAIDNLPEPMVFRGSLGTGGTITALPVDGTAKVGDTYKVITAGTYASKAAKVGDTFVCLTKTASANTWELIPSGDEPSGTVTSIKISATSPISIDSNAAITTSGERTISHANSGVTAGTYRSVTVNATGHVTGGTNPTTIAGYGITDAKIANGVITLGSNTITPLTSHQTVTDNNPSLSWGTKSKVATIGSTEINVTMPINPNTDRYVNSAAFADDSTNTAASPVKMTLTRAGSDTATVTANIPKVSSSSAGVVPKGAAVSSQSQNTKFLREDGTWAKPSYTTNTNTTYTLGTSGNTVTLTPSSGSVQSITVPFATNATNATKATQDASGDVITTTYRKLSNNDFDTINATEVNAGDLIVTGVGRFTNGLYGDLSGTATQVSSNLKIQLNSGTTEGTNQFTYDGSAAKTVNITKTSIGLGNVDNTADANKNVASANTAGSATKATQDESGNNIKATYAASFSISDHTITLKNKNGVSLGTVTVPDNNDNTWRKVQVNGTDILGTATNTNPLNLKAGTNVSLSNSSGTVTITATDTIYSLSASGESVVLSGSDNSSNSVSLSTLINGLGVGTSTPYGTDYYIAQYAGGGTTNNTYYRRPISALWTYMQGQADSRYLKLSGGTMTGGINMPGNQDSAWNDKGIVFSNGSRIGESSVLGIYGCGSIYLRPNAGSGSNTEGIQITTDGLIPDSNNTESLGDSSHKWKYIYATYLNQSSNTEVPTTSSYWMFCNSDGYLRKSTRENFEKVIYPYEANLRWGGRNLTATYSPLDAALADPLRANRLAGVPAAAVTVEYTRDGGTTWTDYGASDSTKKALFTTSTGLVIGKADSTNKATEHGTDYQLRVTVDSIDGNIYTTLQKFIMLISTNGSSSCKVRIEGAKGSDVTTFNTLVEDTDINGWSGYNVINTSFTTYGNPSSASSQYRKIRFIFWANGGSSTYTGLQVLSIYGYGGVGWGCPSTLAKTGHVYTYDPDLNVAFPSSVSVGTRVATTAPSSATSVNRITIVPYYHTGGPWYIASKDDASNSYITFRYGNNEVASIKHTGLITANGFSGPLTGNVTGNCSGSSGSCTGNSATATTASNLNGFTNTTTTGTAIDSATQNGHVYVTGTSGIYSQNDGAAFVQAYSTSWVVQIYQDYRTGQIALRGKNNGTWQAWRKVWDSVNLTSKTAAASGTDLSLVTTGEKATWNAKPSTDTKNTAGSTDTSSKIYLIGATSQAANPQTYSDNEVYTTSGVLTTKSVQVGGGSATMEYSATTKSINFVFAS